MLSARKILVIKRDALGDVISVTPFLEVLRRSFPKAHITYLVGSWSQAVLKNNPNINELIVLDSKKWQKRVGKFRERAKLIRRLKPRQIDIVFILQGPAPFRFWEKFAANLGVHDRIGFRRHAAKTTLTHSVKLPPYRHHLFQVLKKNRAEHYLDLLRAVGVTETKNRGNQLYPAAVDDQFAKDFFARHNFLGQSVIAIAPGGAVNPGMKQLAKRWPAARYTEVIKQLTAKVPARILFLGGSEDRKVIDTVISRLPADIRKKTVSAAGEADVHQSAALIEKSTLFLGNDSGALHMASTTKTPIIGIFGPTNPVVDGPYKAKGKMLFHKTKYSPCYTLDCKGHEPCIEKVTVNEVTTTATTLLSRL